MDKFILTIMILVLFSSCSGKRTQYIKNENFNKLNTSQLIRMVYDEQVSPNQIKDFKELARNDVEWKDFWKKIQTEKIAVISQEKRNALFDYSINICNVHLKNTILNKLLKHIDYNPKNVAVLNDIILICPDEKDIQTEKEISLFHKKNPNYKKLNINQLYLILTDDKYNRSDIINIKQLARDDVSWVLFWSNISSTTLENTPPHKFQALLKVSTSICGEATKNTIIKKLINKLEYKEYDLELINDLILNCDGELNTHSRDSLKEFIKLSLFNTKDLNLLISNFNILYKTSSFIDLSQSNRMSYGLSEQDYANIGRKILQSYDLKSLFFITDTHYKLFPNSSSFRQDAIKTFLNRPSVLKTVLKNNTLEDTLLFLKRSIIHHEFHIPQPALQLIFNEFILKFQLEFDNRDSFYLYDRNMDHFIKMYFDFFNILKVVQDIDNFFQLTIFNKINKIAEKIMLHDQEVSLYLLSRKSGSDKLLATFHSLRIENKISRTLRHKGEDLQISSLTPLDQILLYRNQLLQGNDDQVNDYCQFLSSKFNILKKVIRIENVSKYTSKIGCFDIIADLSIPMNQYNQYILSGTKLESPYDTVFMMKDTDVKLKFDFYDGPVWIISTQREWGQKTIAKEKLDVSLIPVLLKISVTKKMRKGLKVGNYTIVYNYNLMYPQYAKNREEYSFTMKGGHRGGNFNLQSNDINSRTPIVISNGGDGEIGPATIEGGKGVDDLEVGDILDKMFHPSNVNKKYKRSTTFMPLQSFYSRLIHSKYSIEIDWELQRYLSNVLCSTSTFCVLNGHKISEYTEEILNEDVIRDFRDDVDDFIMTKSHSLYLSKFFFPPPIEGHEGNTVFENGEKGQKGKVYFNDIPIE